MSRIIKTESASRMRTKILQSIANAFLWATQQQGDDKTIRDIAAFIALGLREIVKSVDNTVLAWEKRDYWLKADKFRLEWMWATQSLEEIETALVNQDMDQILQSFGSVVGQIAGVKIPVRMKKTQPWIGAYDEWSKSRG